MSNYDDKYDLILNKAMLDHAKEEGISLKNSKIITIGNDSHTEENAEKMYSEVKKIMELKEKLFSNVDIDELEPEEYEKLLKEFHESIKIEANKKKLNEIKKKYPNINFDELDIETPKSILTGDSLYEYFINTFGNDWNYSSVIMEWCRAVELELRNKIFKYLNSYNIRIDIENRSAETEYYNENKRNRPNFKKLIVNDMMGFYGAMKKFGMTEYVFNTYIESHYTNFTLDSFKKMIDYIEVVNEYRDNSAHSINTIKIDKTSADDCKEYIVASKRILEILSNLKKR